MKTIMNIKGVKALSKNEQQQVFGGWPVGFADSCTNPSGLSCDPAQTSMITGNPDCRLNETCSAQGVCVCA